MQRVSLYESSAWEKAAFRIGKDVDFGMEK